MAESRRKFDQDFKEGAVRLVRETGHPIAQIAKDLGINPGTLANWVALDRQANDGNGRLSEDERIELARLRREDAELAMERDVLKRSVALWVKTRRVGGSRGRVHRGPEGRVRVPHALACRALVGGQQWCASRTLWLAGQSVRPGPRRW
jgi:transposase